MFAVGAGAYGRHAVAGDYPREVFAIAAHYQITHALALLAVAWLSEALGANWRSAVSLAGAAFALGIILFSGSLYAVALTGTPPLQGAAPAGGLLLMAGWLALLWTALRRLIRP